LLSQLRRFSSAQKNGKCFKRNVFDLFLLERTIHMYIHTNIHTCELQRRYISPFYIQTWQTKGHYESEDHMIPAISNVIDAVYLSETFFSVSCFVHCLQCVYVGTYVEIYLHTNLRTCIPS
jgi:hypothetical protein